MPGQGGGCFGAVEPGTARDVCGYRVSLERSGEACLYTRVPGSVEVLVPGCLAEVAPLQPIYYPERMTGFVALVLPRPVVVEPGGEARLCLEAELDAAAVAPGGGVVDVFTPGRGKYGLYGPPSRGTLARWARTGLVEAGGRGCLPRRGCVMAVELVLRNESRGAVAFTRVVYRAAGLPLAYRGCLVAGPRVEAVATSPATARVEAEPRTPDGYRAAAPPELLRRPAAPGLPLPRGGGRSVYVMRHGL